MSQTPTIGIEDNEIKIGVVDSIKSKILGEKRQIWVSVPNSYEESGKKFPVLYVLDGREHFYSIVGMVQQLSVANGNTILPEMIVVAIPNTNRIKNLTPSSVPYLPGSGGSDDFSDFLEKELIPFIDTKYPTIPYRTILGHSWGGLFVISELIRYPTLFDNFISIDPTIRWDQLKFFNEASQILKTGNFERKSLYVGVANRIPADLNLNTVLKDSTNASEHIRTILKFNQISTKAKGLNFDWKFYPNDNHNGVPFIAGYDALRFLFDWYHFDEEFLFQEGASLETQQLMGLIIRHYENVSNHFGFPFLPPEATINRFGNIMMSEQEFEKAFAFYDLNVKNYPKRFQVFEVMGDYFTNRNDPQKAKEYYEKSLKIEQSDRVQRKLSNF